MSHPFGGPLDDDWQTTDRTELAALVFALCGELRNFNINTELRVSAGTSDPGAVNFMSMDAIDGSIDTTYQFAWKSCP